MVRMIPLGMVRPRREGRTDGRVRASLCHDHSLWLIALEEDGLVSGLASHSEGP